MSPSPKSHQMCQMRAKPVSTAKNAVMNPVGLLRGASIGSYLGSASGAGWAPCAFDFMSQYGSMLSTCGRTAKLNGGGGEAVDHSSVRPSQGSPVGSRRRARLRIDTL